MEDDEIVELFWQRSESAIAATQIKYSKYCRSIAYSILRNYEDAQECVNDALVNVWNAIPPARPSVLCTFLGKITRNLSINALEKLKAQKRGLGQVPLVLSELDECVGQAECEALQRAELEAITDAVNAFLEQLDAEKRKVFVRRYWYASSLEEIACDYSMNVSKVKSILFRLRKKLKRELEKEGVSL
ncbi:MAG: sigma-70 family RNA polymerase sigma factor [Clostridiales bacterium]|jgi:RNA polymerase sigma-70 factor (ECF subfamily)|nr:sigma-70 family RNA polymerase sigma factor [Clostridiales bacterium]